MDTDGSTLDRTAFTEPHDGSYENASLAYRLRTMLEGTRAGTWEWNIQSGEVHLNQRWAEIAGYTLEELWPLSIERCDALVHPDDLRRFRDCMREHFEGHAAYFQCEARIRHRNGSWVWVRDYGRIVTRTPSGQPEWINGTRLDINDSKQQEQEVARSRDILRRAQQIGRLGYWQANMTTGELEWSDIIYDIFGVDPATFEPSVKAFHEMVHPDDLPEVQASHERALKTGVHDVVHRIIRPDGSIRWVHEVADLQLSGPEAETMLGTVRDVTEQKQLEIRLREQSTSDELTGAANRRHFVEQISQEFERFRRHEQAASLILFDFDHFKRVNDQYGHAAGDQVLALSVAALQRRVRATDCLARIGGEEFAILLPATPLEQAVMLAEKLRAAIDEQTFYADSESFRATITCGVTEFHETDESFEKVMQRADEAMYRGKAAGRNRVCQA